MTVEINSFGQPIGVDLGDWHSPPFPPHQAMTGRFCILEPLQADRHARELWDANSKDTHGLNWTYLPYGPFADFAEYEAWLRKMEAARDPQFYTIIDTQLGRAVGVAAYLRIDPTHGVIEVGHLNFSPLMQQKPVATEAMYLMMANAFALGYRRYEWKCNSLNFPSRQAAQRLGLSYEGTFRQAIVVKGRNRDTTWYAAIDGEWPQLKGAFETWLSPDNFDTAGQQRQRLSELTAPVLKLRG